MIIKVKMRVISLKLVEKVKKFKIQLVREEMITYPAILIVSAKMVRA